jgi:hypothetical protein
LEYENRIMQIENYTIRHELQNQQLQWAMYQERQQECEHVWDQRTLAIRQLWDELEELRAIADPRIRSAVNFTRNAGYQEKVTGVEWAAEGREAVGAVGVKPQRSSFAQMDATACANLNAFLATMQKKAGVKKSKELNCHEQREQLQEAFNQAYLSIVQEINNTDSNAVENRSVCFSEATYRYKYEVEGPGKIDDKIEEAAKKIHDAQLAIARLEPRLHDVEHAAGRMDRYIGHMNTTCTVDEGVSTDLKRIKNLIKTLQACPGRNDFTIDVPHWSNPAATTPSPTPWHGRDSGVIQEWENRYNVA